MDGHHLPAKKRFVEKDRRFPSENKVSNGQKKEKKGGDDSSGDGIGEGAMCLASGPGEDLVDFVLC